MRGKLLAIVGAPGCGKTYLVRKLREHYRAPAFMEVEGGGLPPRIMEDIAENIRPLERILFFRNQMVEKHKAALETISKKPLVILDTSWATYIPWIEVLTEGFEREILEKLAAIDAQTYSLPDMIIFLKADIDTTRRFIEIRDRHFERNDPWIHTVQKVQEAHERFFTEDKTEKIQTIDRSRLDFDRPDDFAMITRLIDAAL